jgi:hypothetical protein
MSVASSSDESEFNYRQIDSFESLLKNMNLYDKLIALNSNNHNENYEEFTDYLEEMRDLIFEDNKDVYTDGWDSYLDKIAHGQALTLHGGKHNKTKSKSTQVKRKQKRLTKKRRYSRR